LATQQDVFDAIDEFFAQAGLSNLLTMLEAGFTVVPFMWPTGPFMPRKANWDGGLSAAQDHAATLTEAERTSYASTMHAWKELQDPG
jgi:hypothetical protein